MALRAFAPAAIALLTLACGLPGRDEGRAVHSSRRLDPQVKAPAAVAGDGALPIAAIFPDVGRYAVSGQQSLSGAQLAVEDLNRAGGVMGRRLRLAAYRTGSYFVDAREAALQAARGGALAIVGSNSSELSQAVAEEAELNGLVQVTNVSTAADLTHDAKTGRSRSFVFRMCASDTVMGALLADFVRDKLAARRVAVLYEVGRAYSARLASSFIQRFADPEAGRIWIDVHYLAFETDFGPQLRLVQEFQPDVVFLPGSSPDATLVAAQARRLGLRAPFVGGDAWSSPLLFQRGAPPGGAYYVELCPPAPDFDRRSELTAAEPPGCRAVLAYDAVRVIAEGLRKLGRLQDEDLAAGLARTRRRLRDAVASGEADGVSGRIRFDAFGDRRQGVALYAVEPTPVGPPQALVHGWLGEP